MGGKKRLQAFNMQSSLDVITVLIAEGHPAINAINWQILCQFYYDSRSIQASFWQFHIFCSDGNQKKAPGNKLPAASPLPGKNGNPTFAAVAAGYDKSPGKYAQVTCRPNWPVTQLGEFLSFVELIENAPCV